MASRSMIRALHPIGIGSAVIVSIRKGRLIERAPCRKSRVKKPVLGVRVL